MAFNESTPQWPQPTIAGEETAMAFLQAISTLSTTQQKQLTSSPIVLNAVLTKDVIQNMPMGSFLRLREAMHQALNYDPIDDMLRDFPGDIATVAESGFAVQLSRASLETFRRGRNLEEDAIRASLVCRKLWPENVCLVDTRSWPKQRPKALVPGIVDTLMFLRQEMDVDGAQWVLAVVKLKKQVGLLGNGAAMTIYCSKQDPPQDHAGTKGFVVRYMRELMPHEPKLKLECKFATCAVQEKLVDSGVAVILNAFAVLGNMPLEQDMSESTCWSRREEFARKCIESAMLNWEAQQRVENVNKGLKIARGWKGEDAVESNSNERGDEDQSSDEFEDRPLQKAKVREKAEVIRTMGAGKERKTRDSNGSPGVSKDPMRVGR